MVKSRLGSSQTRLLTRTGTSDDVALANFLRGVDGDRGQLPSSVLSGGVDDRKRAILELLQSESRAAPPAPVSMTAAVEGLPRRMAAPGVNLAALDQSLLGGVNAEFTSPGGQSQPVAPSGGSTASEQVSKMATMYDPKRTLLELILRARAGR
jgi:hypothetical protein